MDEHTDVHLETPIVAFVNDLNIQTVWTAVFLLFLKKKKKDHDFFWISVSDGIKPITEKCCKYAI